MLQYSAKASESRAGVTSMYLSSLDPSTGDRAMKLARMRGAALLDPLYCSALEMKPQYPTDAGPASPKPRLVHPKLLDFLGWRRFEKLPGFPCLLAVGFPLFQPASPSPGSTKDRIHSWVVLREWDYSGQQRKEDEGSKYQPFGWGFF